MRVTITKTAIDKMKPGDVLYDQEVKGLIARYRKEQVSYALRTRINGKQAMLTIGKHGSPWEPKSARDKAKSMLADIAAGIDLQALKNADKQAPIVSTLLDRYLQDYASEHKKQRSYDTDKSNIDNWVRPCLGSIQIDAVSKDDIAKFLHRVSTGDIPKKTAALTRKGGSELRGGKGVANRIHSLLSKLFNLAEDWGARDQNSNPTKGWTRFKESPVERYLSFDEFQRLGQAMTKADADKSESPIALGCLMTIMLTGARKGEIQNALWSEVDRQTGFLRKADSKTGKKAIALSAIALGVLDQLPRFEGNQFVFPSEVKVGEAIGNTGIRNCWVRLCKSAEIEGARIHDLRHSFASLGVQGGTSLAVLQQALGHSNQSMTERYAHIGDASLKAATEEIGNQVYKALGVKGKS